MKKKRIKIGGVARFVFKYALKLLEERIIEKFVKDETAEEGLKLLLKPFEKLVLVLTDENENNKEQVLQVWKEFQPDLINYSFEALKELIEERIQETELKQSLFFIVDLLKEVVQALIDADPNDNQQMIQIVKQFENKLYLIAINIVNHFVLNRIKDELFKELLQELLEDLKDLLQQEN